DALEGRGAAVLVAPPGAGKTTRVPLALLDAPWLEGQRIIMLEPRRLAARNAATYMARLLGEPVGRTVGYRIRHDTKASRDTRIEVVTEGVLARLLIDDPALSGTGIVVFDEFHERSIHADTGLALTLQARSLLRPELRVLVMSATLDAAPVAALLDGAPVIRSEGRAYPVETYHVDAPATSWSSFRVQRRSGACTSCYTICHRMCTCTGCTVRSDRTSRTPRSRPPRRGHGRSYSPARSRRHRSRSTACVSWSIPA